MLYNNYILDKYISDFSDHNPKSKINSYSKKYSNTTLSPVTYSTESSSESDIERPRFKNKYLEVQCNVPRINMTNSIHENKNGKIIGDWPEDLIPKDDMKCELNYKKVKLAFQERKEVVSPKPIHFHLDDLKGKRDNITLKNEDYKNKSLLIDSNMKNYKPRIIRKSSKPNPLFPYKY